MHMAHTRARICIRVWSYAHTREHIRRNRSTVCETGTQPWGAGTHQCGAGTSHLHRRGALEPTSVALEPQTCTGMRRWKPHPVWSFKSIKRNGVCGWVCVCCLLGSSIVVEGRCQAVSAVGANRRQSGRRRLATVGAGRRRSAPLGAGRRKPARHPTRRRIGRRQSAPIWSAAVGAGRRHAVLVDVSWCATQLDARLRIIPIRREKPL